MYDYNPNTSKATATINYTNRHRNTKSTLFRKTMMEAALYHAISMYAISGDSKYIDIFIDMWT